MNEKTKKIITKTSIIILIILALGLAVFFCFKYLKSSNKLVEFENKRLVKQISSHIVLPNEIPTFATVADKTRLINEPFFKNAENGDKVLIFTNAGRVVLYRPSIKKIVDISTVTVNSETITPTPTPVANESKIKIALLNGSDTTGLANKTEKEIFSQIDGIQIVSKDNARSKYDKNIIVVVNKDYTDLAGSLATLLKGEINSLPDGEKTSNADILIILGKNN